MFPTSTSEARLANLEAARRDHDKRIRFLERWVSIATGATGFLGILFKLLGVHHA